MKLKGGLLLPYQNRDKTKAKEIFENFLHLWTFKTPTFALKKYKNVKSILMVLLFFLLFYW